MHEIYISVWFEMVYQSCLIVFGIFLCKLNLWDDDAVSQSELSHLLYWPNSVGLSGLKKLTKRSGTPPTSKYIFPVVIHLVISGESCSVLVILAVGMSASSPVVRILMALHQNMLNNMSQTRASRPWVRARFLLWCIAGHYCDVVQGVNMHGWRTWVLIWSWEI